MSRPLPYSVPPTEEHYSSSTRTRIALEAVAFTSLSFMGPFFLAFGLDYTGRGNLIRTPLFGIVAIVPAASSHRCCDESGSSARVDRFSDRTGVRAGNG